MSFDAVSYVMGYTAGTGKVVLEDTENYTFTDEGEGEIVIEEASDGE